MKKTRIVRAATLLAALLAIVFGVNVWRAVRTPDQPAWPPLVVNDVTQLNPVRVAAVIAPTTTDEIIHAVSRASGPVSIGGARHSMGGQVSSEGSLHIDMRGFNRILSVSPADRTITVQAGATWRQIQEEIDRADLSIKVMQSFANFTVGGTLSVNAHGRYVGAGPIIRTVRSIKVVLADGSLIDASPRANADIFYGAIGGYGGVGVITEATLELTINERVKRRTELLPVSSYRQYFMDRIRGRDAPVFHSANIFAPGYSEIRTVTYEKTNDPVTVADRLVPLNQSYRLSRFAFWVSSEWPFGKSLQRYVIDPVYFSGEPVVWRNYEASHDVAWLEPASRADSTFVLQEYFVPIARFDEFVPRMGDVLRRHEVNVLNVAVRHAIEDPGSLLAWARGEVFAFVIYFKHGTNQAARDKVGLWTRELTDAALGVGGSYYLPYQIHATREQFDRAYPRAGEYFALKRRVDPTNKFRNALLDKYSR